MYEYRFVDKPFQEPVDGIMCTFDSIDWIDEIKSLCVSNNIELSDMEKFVRKNEGWIGLYGTYMNPIDVIAGFIESNK